MIGSDFLEKQSALPHSLLCFHRQLHFKFRIFAEAGMRMGSPESHIRPAHIAPSQSAPDCFHRLSATSWVLSHAAGLERGQMQMTLWNIRRNGAMNIPNFLSLGSKCLSCFSVVSISDSLLCNLPASVSHSSTAKSSWFLLERMDSRELTDQNEIPILEHLRDDVGRVEQWIADSSSHLQVFVRLQAIGSKSSNLGDSPFSHLRIIRVGWITGIYGWRCLSLGGQSLSRCRAQQCTLLRPAPADAFLNSRSRKEYDRSPQAISESHTNPLFGILVHRMQ